ncbi:MAG: hypothetical protein U0S50_04250 [Sphingopyxis sp.]|uniref:hypothetical protein n=1 Tax=Sphingopyxis sp. TaxID=1908224 RepID=UPI002AB84101|nr:hypothetical protein [Sphingopyxis sp.]MDZ3831012.1 hypothetical protein [Sphingopyxis sp.]
MRKASLSPMLAALVLAGALGGCDRTAQDAGEAAIDAGNPLEMAARERGIVRSETPVPTGVFERRHDLGRDAMCVVPDGAGRWRFSLTAAFGPGLSCATSGSLSRDGDGWRMRFGSAEDCVLTADESDDIWRLPGRLPDQCAALCPGRATLAGLELPRASWSEGDARDLRMRDQRGNMARPCAAGPV